MRNITTIEHEQDNLDYSTVKTDYLNALGLNELNQASVIANWNEHYLGTEIRAFLGLQYPNVCRKNETKIPLYLNLNESTAGGVGPHGLIAGQTGAGRTSLEKALFTSVAALNHPEMVNFIFMNFRDDHLEHARFQDFPHTIAIESNLEENFEGVTRIREIVEGITCERQTIFNDLTRASGVVIENITDYNRLRRKDVSLPAMPYIFLVMDNSQRFLFSSLVPGYAKNELNFFIDFIARIGKSVGVYLILSDQSCKSNTITTDTISNITWGVSLYQNSSEWESRELVMGEKFISEYDSAFDSLKIPGDFLIRYPAADRSVAYAKCCYPDLKLPPVERTRTVTTVEYETEKAEFILVNFASGITTVGETVSHLDDTPLINEDSLIKLNQLIREINRERTRIFCELTKELVNPPISSNTAI